MESQTPGAAWREIFLLGERLRTLWQTPEMRRKSVQLPLSQAKVMFFVFACAPGNIRQKDIAVELGVTPGAVSQTLDALESAGLIERLPDPADRRAILIRPSKMADSYRTQRDQALGGIMAHLLSEISPDEAKTFLSVLKHLTTKAGDALRVPRDGAGR